MQKSFTPTEFMKALSEGALRDPIVKEGFVKQDGNDPSALLFSEGTSCVVWTKIPLDMIERVDYIRSMRCQDHEHPLVRLHLKEPDPSNTAAAVFAALAKAVSRAPVLTPLIQAPRTRRRGDGVSRHHRTASARDTYYGAYGIAHCGNGEFIPCGVICDYDSSLEALNELWKEAEYTCYNKGGLLWLNNDTSYTCD